MIAPTAMAAFAPPDKVSEEEEVVEASDVADVDLAAAADVAEVEKVVAVDTEVDVEESEEAGFVLVVTGAAEVLVVVTAFSVVFSSRNPGLDICSEVSE